MIARLEIREKNDRSWFTGGLFTGEPSREENAAIFTLITRREIMRSKNLTFITGEGERGFYHLRQEKILAKTFGEKT